MARRERVGLELVLARREARERLEREREHGHDEREAGEQRADVRRIHAERRVERRLVRRASRARHSMTRASAKRSAHARDVAAGEVAELVREHRLDLGRLEALEQGVEEHDALGLAEAAEVGVAVARALRSVHHVQARDCEAAAREQRARCARRSSPSASGVKRLKSGAIQRGKTTTSARVNTIQHQPGVEPPERPQASSSQRTPGAAARRSRRRALVPFTRSMKKSRGVMRLKPWRSSITKVRQRSKGRRWPRCWRASRRTRCRARACPGPSQRSPADRQIAATPPPTVSARSSSAPSMAQVSTSAKRSFSSV